MAWGIPLRLGSVVKIVVSLSNSNIEIGAVSRDSRLVGDMGCPKHRRCTESATFLLSLGSVPQLRQLFGHARSELARGRRTRASKLGLRAWPVLSDTAARSSIA
jgi:hypothetical protein